MIVTYSSSIWVSLRQSNDTGKLVQELALLGISFYSEPVLKGYFLVLKKTGSVSSAYTELDFILLYYLRMRSRTGLFILAQSAFDYRSSIIFFFLVVPLILIMTKFLVHSYTIERNTSRTVKYPISVNTAACRWWLSRGKCRKAFPGWKFYMGMPARRERSLKVLPPLSDLSKILSMRPLKCSLKD